DPRPAGTFPFTQLRLPPHPRFALTAAQLNFPDFRACGACSCPRREREIPQGGGLHTDLKTAPRGPSSSPVTGAAEVSCAFLHFYRHSLPACFSLRAGGTRTTSSSTKTCTSST